MPLTFRVDDVSSNTDLSELKEMIKDLNSRYICDVWLCVNPFSKRAIEGSVYPEPPFKGKVKEFFYNINQQFDVTRLNLGQTHIVSHGLFHIDHSNLQYDAQEMSIVGSCNLLGADIFVPPFNRFSDATEAVCRHHGIRLIKSYDEGWRSLEHEPFDETHSKWYWHPWRFNADSFKETIDSKKLGLVS